MNSVLASSAARVSRHHVSVTRCLAGSPWWAQVQAAPLDPIVGLTELFNKDSNPNKVNLGVGAYRDNNGKPWVLPTVRKAEEQVYNAQLDKEYLGIVGDLQFTPLALKLALGEEGPAAAATERSCTVQTISGTGALRVAGNFIAKFMPADKRAIWLPAPSWGNHTPIFRDAGLEVNSYKYYNPGTFGLDLEGMLAAIEQIPAGHVILLHPSAHNPTGVDPTPEQWVQIEEVIARKKLLPLFDMAYQGFASGDFTKDAFALRHFAAKGHSAILTQSFAKNMGLYGLRVGALSFICNDKEEANRVMSQVKAVIRPMYSMPPSHGVRIAKTILLDTAPNGLRDQWQGDVKVMSSRIIDMRAELVAKLSQAGSSRDWAHVTNQIGMFCFTGMNQSAVEKLIKDYSIYLTKDGRISVSGLTPKNVEYVAASIHAVTK